MDFKGLVISTDNFSFDETLDSIESPGSGIDVRFDIGIDSSLVTSQIEMSYCKTKNLDKPLARLKTTLKFWLDEQSVEVGSSERVLYSVKTQYSYMYFILYQKLSELNLDNLNLFPPTDKTLYTIISKQFELADLTFDEHGNYNFPF